MHLLSHFFKKTSGATVLEFAFTFPVFLLFLFGAIELGIVMWGKTSLTYATTQAARYAYVNQSTASNGAVQTYANSLIPVANGSLFSFSFIASVTPHVSATVNGTFTYNFLYLPVTALSLKAVVVQPLP